MLIALLIPVFNGLDFTRKSLSSLIDDHRIGSGGSSVRIVIIDDGSTDGTAEWVSRQYPQVHIVKGNGNLWWSGGINAGVEFALDRLNADYILWWNNDIIPEKEYFTNLESILANEPADTILGSKIYMDPEKSIIWSMGGYFNPRSGKKYMFGNRTKESEEYLSPTEADWLPGMGTVTHRSVYERIGLLHDKGFPQYHGDSDFTWRAKKNGFRLWVRPELVIYNDTSNSGIRHNDSLGRLIDSMTSLRSNYNLKKDILFYRTHSESAFAYRELLVKYLKYVGGFFKWRLLSLVGIKRKSGLDGHHG